MNEEKRGPLENLALVTKANSMKQALGLLHRAAEHLVEAQEKDLVRKAKRLGREIIGVAFKKLPGELFRAVSGTER